MVHEIIKHGNYLLIVDDSEIKTGDWVLANFPSLGFHGIVKWVGGSSDKNVKKIVAHLPLPKSKLEGVDVLPDFTGDLFPKYFDSESGKYIY